MATAIASVVNIGLKYPDDFIDKIICGDNLSVMPLLPDECVDLIPTDPPYGIEFMGKDWDKALPPIETWKECLRVLKPGAFAFVMCIPRQDCLSRMIISLEDAGFNVNFTSLYWTYASGFPKAQNISKAIDKRACKQELTEKLGRKPTKDEFNDAWRQYREVIKEIRIKSGGTENLNLHNYNEHAYRPNDYQKGENILDITIPASSEAKALNGSFGGFQPKPAVEVIIVAMKPLSEKTYVDQALANKKGITWLDDCRIPYESEDEYHTLQENRKANRTKREGAVAKGYGMKPQGLINSEQSPQGRFPANLLISDDVLNDGVERKSGLMKQHIKGGQFNVYGKQYPRDVETIGDRGQFSRFYSLDAWWAEKLKQLPKEVQKTFPFLIVPKASKSEKNKGLENMPDKLMARSGGAQQAEKEGKEEYLQNHIGLNRISKVKNNDHPTVKPIQLGSYLVTLGSREGDVTLDPFCGSGSFCISAYNSSRHFIGIEKEKSTHEIAEARVKDILMMQL